MKKEKQLLDDAMQAWSALASFRSRRRRAKDFTFGRQWNDRTRLADGRVITEAGRWLEKGVTPVSNNLIRQLVKSIVGQWRYLKGDEARGREGDTRTLEEYIISGAAIQRVEAGGDARNISPERIFFRRFLDADAGDCTFIGCLHDIEPSEVIARWGGPSPTRFAAILEAYRSPAGRAGAFASAPPCEAAASSFGESDTAGRWRVTEVWERVAEPSLRVHDPSRGLCGETPYCEESMADIATVNEARISRGEERLRWHPAVRDYWRGTWLAPDGTVLGREESDRHPFAVALYPMIDGEVHSLVEDVIDQQKQVNNLVMLLEEVLRASAKGVVMFPVDQLPRGMTWRDVREIWSRPGGILPFRRTSKNIMPYQLDTGKNLGGAAEFLNIQLRLFDEISGTNASSRGASSTAKGAEMLHRELEQATVAVYDILSSFDAFLRRRDALAGSREA